MGAGWMGEWMVGGCMDGGGMYELVGGGWMDDPWIYVRMNA